MGASQRHTGKARTGFRLRPTGTIDRDSILVNDTFVTIEGLEFDGSLSTAPNGAGGVDIETGTTTPVGHYVSHNIIYETRNFSGIYVTRPRPTSGTTSCTGTTTPPWARS